MNELDRNSDGKKSVFRRANELRRGYPIIFNLILIVIAGLIVVWLLMLFLSNWTLHGQEEEIPDVKGLNVHIAAGTLQRNGMEAIIADSVYDTKAMPGTVVDQNPKPMSKVKPGRSVYLTIVAYTPKMVSFPKVDNTSLRQGRSMIEGLGIKQVVVKEIPSEYEGLVLGAYYNGKKLNGGEKIPVNGVITLEVGALSDGDDNEFTGEDIDNQ